MKQACVQRMWWACRWGNEWRWHLVRSVGCPVLGLVPQKPGWEGTAQPQRGAHRCLQQEREDGKNAPAPSTWAFSRVSAGMHVCHEGQSSEVSCHWDPPWCLQFGELTVLTLWVLFCPSGCHMLETQGVDVSLVAKDAVGPGTRSQWAVLE